MTIKSDNIQIGQNATATQNFVLKQGADGTGGLYRGNVGAESQAIVTWDATGLVTMTQGKQLTLATAQATTSGTSITFSSIPSWAKRITINFKGVGTSGTSPKQIQLGSGSVTTTGYLGGASSIANSGAAGVVVTTGFSLYGSTAADRLYGQVILTLESAGTNTWCANGAVVATPNSGTYFHYFTAGTISLSGTLDRVILTTVNGTDTFAAGELNIMYEG